MSMQLKARFASGLLEVEVRGEFSLDEAKRTFLEMLDSAGRHGAAKVLFDGRGLKGEPEVMERFFYGEFAATETARAASEGNLPRVPRFAYVLEEPVLDPRRFGENVASNRGMIVKTFGNREEALKWLEVDSAGKS
jgi:hypothetical protein